jgi:lysophospholipase L1-like esterase
VNKRLATILTPPLLPVLLIQGYWTKKRTPRLPDAGGPLEGTVNGTGESIKLITLGESTVAGIGALTHETALTGHLATALCARTRKSVNWLVVARSGITARESLAELVPKLSGHSADVVVIALGVNDSIAFHTARRWASDIELLINTVRREVGNSLVVLAGVPPLDHFPALRQPLGFVLGARSATLDHASAQIATRLEGVIHVPFKIEKERSRELFCQDGFHPSELGYSLWAEQLAEALAKLPIADNPGQ